MSTWRTSQFESMPLNSTSSGLRFSISLSLMSHNFPSSLVAQKSSGHSTRPVCHLVIMVLKYDFIHKLIQRPIADCSPLGSYAESWSGNFQPWHKFVTCPCHSSPLWDVSISTHFHLVGQEIGHSTWRIPNGRNFYNRFPPWGNSICMKWLGVSARPSVTSLGLLE